MNNGYLHCRLIVLVRDRAQIIREMERPFEQRCLQNELVRYATEYQTESASGHQDQTETFGNLNDQVDAKRLKG